ncbi:class III lanthionine synthetase LanKC N-terminal domain-containing protein [Bacteroides thetaiotaomicron]
MQEHQGFKIHISATIKNYEQILDIIFNFCKKIILHLSILLINMN